MKSLCISVSALSFIFLLGCHFCVDQPRAQKLADCSTNALAFRLAWPTGELFNIVLGVPYSNTNTFAFRGELVFRQGTGMVARLAFSSQDATACNWLDHKSDPRSAGYILTWGRTNSAERLDNLFAKGQSYDVEVHFTESPPPASTLWLHWIGRSGH